VSRRTKSPAKEPASDRAWVPITARLLATIVGLGAIVAVALRPHNRLIAKLPLDFLDPLSIAAKAATIVIGVLLLLLGRALGRRKKRAFQLAVFLLAFIVILGREERLVAAVFLVGLIIYRREFYALSDPRTRWGALWVFFQLLSISLIIGVVLTLLRAKLMVGNPSNAEILKTVVRALVGLTGPVVFKRDRTKDFIDFTLGALGLLTVLVPTLLFFRPSSAAPKMTDIDERDMRNLIASNCTNDSLAYFALRREKSVIWSPTKKSCIAYRVVSGVMLASGDPLGDREAWPLAIEAFLVEAKRHAWLPAVMGCSEQGGEIWVRESRLVALEMGDEAIIEVDEFTLEGRAMRNVRQMISRIERNGYSASLRRLDQLSADERLQVFNASNSWRKGNVERGFSMALGRLTDPSDDECYIVTASVDGVLKGILHFVPWGSDGLSLDLMRRDKHADPGLNELMIVSALQQAPKSGITRISLNFAAFRSIIERGERLGAGPITRLMRNVLIFVSRWLQIDSLYRFIAKFRPIWEPRYLVYPRQSDLPKIGLATLEAEAFFIRPRFLERGHIKRQLD
jgi:lysyl-tRNA synthetase class 2